MLVEPMGSAALSQPSPPGPTCRMSLAYTGSNAVAPPSSTANRSSVIVPRITGVPKTKRRPTPRVRQGHALRFDDFGASAHAGRSEHST